jgi:acetyl-CoA C-acetyltransferase
LREHPEAIGLATALGWYSTKHAIGLYGATPPSRPFRSMEPQPENDTARRARTDYAGRAQIEAFTVKRDRDGNPESAAVSALTPDGERAMLALSHPELIATLLEHDLIGAEIAVRDPHSFSLAS